ncbi:flap endonuclease GEN-like 1 protein [Tanacetum coccineum]
MCLADASLHVPFDEIKVDKTLCFVEELVENSDREIKRLKCSRMVVVKEDKNTLYRSRRLWEEMEDLKDANFFVELARDNSVVYSPTIASAGVLKASGEAEGLCAQLNCRGHVDTCITSDSDAFLFGAKYIKDGLGVKRIHMIAIALLV